MIENLTFENLPTQVNQLSIKLDNLEKLLLQKNEKQRTILNRICKMGELKLKNYRQRPELRVLKKEPKRTSFKPWLLVMFMILAAIVIYNAKKQNKKESLEQYVEKVLKKKKTAKRYFIGKLPNILVNVIGAYTKKDAQGYKYVIKAMSINHIDERHGHTKEFHKNQRGVQVSDYRYLVNTLNNPDSLSQGYDTKVGNRTIKFYKFQDNEVFVVLVEVSTKYETFSVITFYIKNKTPERVSTGA